MLGVLLKIDVCQYVCSKNSDTSIEPQNAMSVTKNRCVCSKNSDDSILML